MSNTVTRGVRIQVESLYQPDHSNPDDDRYIFSYHIRVSNEGETPVKLVSRHWKIIDGDGNQEDVRGFGVVGQQPRLMPGDKFDYTSFCPLRTNFGTMEGSYMMQFDSGECFDARIDRFYLATGKVAVS